MTLSVRQNAAKVAIAAVLAFAMAVPLAAFVTQAPAGRLVLIETRGLDARGLQALGLRSVVDYQNGIALVRMDSTLGQLPYGVREHAQLYGSRTFLMLDQAGYSFDTEIGVHELRPDLRGTGEEFIVQFIGPIRSEWVREAESLGAEFSSYFANYAFAVRGPAGLRDALAALPTVQWVGDYQPVFKITSQFRDVTGDVRAFAIGWPGVSTASLARVVQDAGGEILQTMEMPSTVEFTADRAVIDSLAQSSQVVRIDESRPLHVMDSRAGQIHKFHQAWSTTRSGLPVTLTGRSAGPDNVMYNADDEFEGIGVMDTGFDEGNANNGQLDMFDSPNGDRVIRFVDRTGASVPDGKCGSAHGTHVIGIIASDGYAWEKYLIEDKGRTDVSLTDKSWDQSEAGVAPEAKVSLDGIQGGNAVFCGTGVAANSNYWDSQYNDGYPTGVASRAWVVTNSNSWGSGAAPYGTYANAVDTRIESANERMIVFAAGNDGPNINTVASESLGKNGLSAGASQNYRPDQFTADNPNNVVDFSGRGPPLGCGGSCTGVIKPDILGVGTAVISNFGRGEWDYNAGNGIGNPTNDMITDVDKYSYTLLGPGSDGRPDYRYLQGTSMSTPHIAGGFALVREYLREVVGSNNPLSTYYNPPSYAAKALLLNGAVRMDPNLYAYPGPDQGWGRMDLEQALFPPAPRSNQITMGQFSTAGSCDVGAGTCAGGGTINAALNTNIVGSDVPLKITLVWLDAAGSQAISRNLELIAVSPGGTEYRGNQYTNGWSTANPGAFDSVNNVEQVEVQAPELGVWSITVMGASIPSTARYAIVIGANVGPTKSYQIDLSTTAPLSYGIAPGGSAVFPFTVTNFGTAPETSPGVGMSTTAPPQLTVTFQPSPSFSLASGASDQGYAVITAGPATPLGVYTFDVRATSGSDPSPSPASDFVTLTVEVATAPVPPQTRITTDSVDELDPSVVVFRDATVGGHIFIPYRKSTPVVPPDQGGVNVWVAHATLNANGVPGTWDYSEVSGTNDNPNDLRILHIGVGAWTYDNRIVITWTGNDPNAADPDRNSWGRSAYLDPGAGPTYYSGTWTVRTIEANYGSEIIAAARVSYPLFRVAGGAGEVMWTWEHLDYAAAGQANPTRVQTHMIRSQDGGNSWPACGVYDPANVNCIQIFPQNAGDNNFYFFPNGVVDQNDVAWLFVYWRTSGGNDRDLNVRLYDGVAGTATPYASLSSNVDVYDTTDNVQWPVALSTAEGAAGNRVYFTVTRDQCSTDFKMFSSYTDGDYTSGTPPLSAVAQNGACNAATYDISNSFNDPLGGPPPLGTSISNANYNRRPILNMVATNSAGTITAWLPVMENENPFGQPNLWTWYQNPGFSNGVVSKVTADAFAKGHQMSDTLTSNTVGCVYEVYHANKGTAVSVNYDVYLVIYCKGWETAPDLLGPITTDVFTSPDPVDLGAGTFDILANVNDVSTGNSDIAAAEYLIDSFVWPGTAMSAVSGFDSPAEAVIATASTGGLSAGAHSLCVRGQDAATNWGAGTCVTITASGSGNPPPLAPTVTGAIVSGGGTFPDVVIQWNKAADDSQAGGTTEYQVMRSTTPTTGFAQIGTVAAVNAPTYTYTCVGCGKGDASNYFFRVRSYDGTSTTNAVAMAAKYTKMVIAGKNLLSVPLAQNSYSIPTVLQTILSYDSVRTYKNSDTSDPWKAYYPARPGDLTILQLGDPLWVEVNAPDQYVIAGLVVTNPSFTLTPGWNFVGYSSFTPVPQETRAVSLAGIVGVARVETYDALIPGDAYRLKVVASGDFMVPGEAYWVLINTGGGGIWVQG